MRFTNLLTVVVVIFALGLGAWWLEDRFGSVAAVAGLVLVFVVLMLVLGWMLSLASSKMVLNAVTQFNQNDAQTDRYRQHTTQELIAGDQLGQRVELVQARRLAQQETAAQARWRWEQEQERRMLVGPVDDRWPVPAPRVIGQDFGVRASSEPQRSTERSRRSPNSAQSNDEEMFKEFD